jgi:hypothetical protein
MNVDEDIEDVYNSRRHQVLDLTRNKMAFLIMAGRNNYERLPPRT